MFKLKEKDIEKYLVKQVKSVHGHAYKFSSPNHRGVPDRICLFPKGRIVFVELKAPGKTPTELQLITIGYLRDLGFCVEVLDNKPDIDRFVRRFK